MPVHDWTRIDAGIFHDFHSAWIIHLRDALNGGILPAGYYALAEQHAGRPITDVLTLESDVPRPNDAGGSTAVAVAEAPPRVSRKAVASTQASLRLVRKTLAIRHVSHHRIVALIEILSQANKDRPSSVQEFVGKVHSALLNGCHLLVIDLFPPGSHDSHGMHVAVWEDFDPEEKPVPDDRPITLAAYVALPLPEAYLEFLRVGDSFPTMPLFLTPENYVHVPLEQTYAGAYAGFPGYWKKVIEGSK